MCEKAVETLHLLQVLALLMVVESTTLRLLDPQKGILDLGPESPNLHREYFMGLKGYEGIRRSVRYPAYK